MVKKAAAKLAAKTRPVQAVKKPEPAPQFLSIGSICKHCGGTIQNAVPVNCGPVTLPDTCTDCKSKTVPEGTQFDRAVKPRPKEERPAACAYCQKELLPEEVAGQVCPHCVTRIELCARCGSKESDEICPKCIRQGVRVCQFCLRPPMKNDSMCEVCKGMAQKGMHAGKFEEPAIPVNTREDFGGTVTLTRPQSEGLAVSSPVFMG